VPVPEALERLLRAALAVGDRYSVILHESKKHAGEEEAEQIIGPPVRSLFQRWVGEGVLREDLDVDVLVPISFNIAAVAIETGTLRTLGVEQTAASVASLFLDGARPPPSAGWHLRGADRHGLRPRDDC
jgi:hypothetical protein